MSLTESFLPKHQIYVSYQCLKNFNSPQSEHGSRLTRQKMHYLGIGIMAFS